MARSDKKFCLEKETRHMCDTKLEFSNIISTAMAYIEKEIEELEKNSVDKDRLRRMVNRHLVREVKRLAIIDEEVRDREIDNIFKEKSKK